MAVQGEGGPQGDDRGLETAHKAGLELVAVRSLPGTTPDLSWKPLFLFESINRNVKWTPAWPLLAQLTL